MRPAENTKTILLTTDEVAETLAVSNRTVRRLMEEGKLKSVLIGKSRRVRLFDLQTFVKGLDNRG